jgi:hypothetical protein
MEKVYGKKKMGHGERDRIRQESKHQKFIDYYWNCPENNSKEFDIFYIVLASVRSSQPPRK